MSFHILQKHKIILYPKRPVVHMTGGELIGTSNRPNIVPSIFPLFFPGCCSINRTFWPFFAGPPRCGAPSFVTGGPAVPAGRAFEGQGPGHDREGLRGTGTLAERGVNELSAPVR